ncbi:MAG: Xaa-Pro dipeptidase [Myxococcales bacterium]|nr:Xaa-Pro dipeptidase [Myxococcales bacterium]
MNLSSLFETHIAYLEEGYAEALTLARYDAVVLHSGVGLKQRTVDDQYWPLKVTPSFAHWLPLLEPGVLVVVEPGKTPSLVRPVSSSFWEGPAPMPGDHFLGSFTVVECAPAAMREHCPSGKVAFIGDDLEAAVDLGFSPEHCNPQALMAPLDALRTIKTEYEVACMTEASRIAARGHIAVDSAFHQGSHSELDLHLLYLRVTQQDSTETPYGNIVAQGANAAILHHVHYGREVDSNPNQSLLVDAGANYMGYASDITRTTVRGDGQAASDFRALIAGLEALQVELIDAVKPGLAYEALHDLSHEKLAKLLLESGLCTGSVEGLLTSGVTRAFFPHGLGHSLGLQVHDVGCRLAPPSDRNPFLRNTSTITTGQAFTLEPGCYFIDALLEPLREGPAKTMICWPILGTLRPFGGIRTEDNLIVSRTASLNLTRDNLSPTN